MNERRFEKVTGAAAIAKTLAPNESFQLVGIKIHLSAVGGAGNLTVTMDAVAGAAYDANVLTQDMTGVTDYINILDTPIPFDAGDELDFAWANASTRTYGLTIIYDLK